jgi:carotenoid cleavage dioxygenase
MGGCWADGRFAVLDARNVAAGPVATVELGETMPISLHGQWVAA